MSVGFAPDENGQGLKDPARYRMVARLLPSCASYSMNHLVLHDT